MYKLDFSKRSERDIEKLKRSEPQAFKKASQLLDELFDHPRTGTGKPEQLKHQTEEIWSRRITDKHRLVYKIEDETVIVLVLSMYGHYQ